MASKQPPGKQTKQDIIKGASHAYIKLIKFKNKIHLKKLNLTNNEK